MKNWIMALLIIISIVISIIIGVIGINQIINSYAGSNIYNVSYDILLGFDSTWDVSNQTRVISNSDYWCYSDNDHSNVWVFTNISLGDSVSIGILFDGDHTFKVVDETIYDLPEYGTVDVWILEDQTRDGGLAWFEKSTGILLNGTFYYGILSIDYYRLEFNATNAIISNVTNENAPVLSSGSVSPSTGNQTTLFNFTVIYSDQDENYPKYVKVLINETSFLMEKQDPLDRVYSDGCLYQCLTYLQPGTYNYIYETSDWMFTNATNTFTGLDISGISNDNAPLLCGQVSPDHGLNGTTLFNFEVTYTDADNDAPSFVNVTINSTEFSMIKRNPTDNNYMDIFLCIYNVVLRLESTL